MHVIIYTILSTAVFGWQIMLTHIRWRSCRIYQYPNWKSCLVSWIIYQKTVYVQHLPFGRPKNSEMHKYRDVPCTLSIASYRSCHVGRFPGKADFVHCCGIMDADFIMDLSTSGTSRPKFVPSHIQSIFGPVGPYRQMLKTVPVV